MQIILDTDVNNTGPLNNFQIGYVFFRVFTGANLFFHGFMRFVNGVSTWEVPTAALFADTFLPMPRKRAKAHHAKWVAVRKSAWPCRPPLVRC